MARPVNLLYRLYEQRLKRELDKSVPVPRHVGVITDGNRRWAKEFGATTADGHRAGAAKIVEFLGWCFEIDVEIVTLYVLSKENLARSAEEVSILIEIISDLVEKIAALDGVGVQLVGDLDILPTDLRARLEAVAMDTDECGMRVNVAVGYGGRQEIVNAVKSLLRTRADEGLELETIISELSPEQIGEHLYTKGQPDPDLIIRSSGEQRLSGFLMWQSAYSEFYFCEAYWPDFRRTDFLRAVRDYGLRQRRFGK
ncbi:isoprenyl transferase [Brevibacterium spongiae]|uniref:isoprenyl transferase n=1 Tax=Brevibacterium spongiae TaxID=2909672 RepID=UPI0024B55126|nr:isoprenyl transferase [Brevibacterium spongiae]